MLRAFGCDLDVEETPDGRLVRLGRRRSLTATTLEIPGDPSSAAFPLVAALVSPGPDVTLRSVLANPLPAALFTTPADTGPDISAPSARPPSGTAAAELDISSSRRRVAEYPAATALTMREQTQTLTI